jgi:hypothetical protein
MGDILVWRFKRNNDKHAKPNIQMNKKAADIELDKLIGIIILVIFFLIIFGAFFRPEKGWLNYVADKAEGFVRFIPGRDEIPRSPTLQIPSDLKKVYDNLYETFVKLKEIDQTKCWAEYDEIPELNKIKITIKASEKGMDMEINNQDQTLSPETIPDLKPCIIAGKASDGTNAARNFELYHALRLTTKIESRKNYVYNDVPSIEIQEEKWGKDEDLKAEDTTYNLDYSNLLYKHDSEHICFIPMVGVESPWGCDGSNIKGLDEDCVQPIREKIDECWYKDMYKYLTTEELQLEKVGRNLLTPSRPPYEVRMILDDYLNLKNPNTIHLWLQLEPEYIMISGAQLDTSGKLYRGIIYNFGLIGKDGTIWLKETNRLGNNLLLDVSTIFSASINPPDKYIPLRTNLKVNYEEVRQKTIELKP